jgi:two-component system sensor histidine kinase KdpD
MTIEDDQPNPDELLKAIQQEEQKESLGRLKIFFGMSAGVGKTYSMLQEAQQKLKDGVNVVAGTINTHGRKETEALLKGLPIIPEKWIKYKEIAFEEMDLEAILEMKPDLVLVDELAHTNVPGSKHPKRWQDVVEILDAGIDVFTTLNVQHLESRKDIVEHVLGIQIRETVPDLILERATEIELVDIPPSELLKRLKEGKVYLGDQSKTAAEHFFQEQNLTALREIALRFTAEKVDHDLHGILQGKGWKTRERLMVAISSSPSSEQLIRATRRLSFELDAPWVVVHVDTGATLSDSDQARLNRYFNLARELGADVLTTHDLDVANALQRVALQKDITRIVIGRPPRKVFNFWNLFCESIVDRLENENRHIDIIILREEKILNVYQNALKRPKKTINWNDYWIAIGFTAGVTILGFIINPIIGYKTIGFIFLLGILILSFFVDKIPMLLAVLLSAFSWDIFFISPNLTPTLSDPEDLTLVIIYFCVAAIMSVLTNRMRKQDQFLQKREGVIERLYEIEHDIGNSMNLQELRINVNSRLEIAFPGKFDILIKNSEDQLIIDSSLPILKEEKEKAVAIWVFHNGKIGGWSTDTLPSAKGIYFPIKFSKAIVGVLAYQPSNDRPLSMEEINFIQTVAHQLGIYLERYIFEERVHKQDYTAQIERTHQSIFHSLNRNFYTPLEGIIEINDQIRKDSNDPHIRSLTTLMDLFISNIKLVIDNIIAISELESGFVYFDKKNHSIKELIDQSLDYVKPFIKENSIKLDIPDRSLFFLFDINLLKLALTNLILNAVEYSRPSTPVYIKLSVFEKEFCLAVLNEGPGIPKEKIPLIFEKFHHIPGSSKGLRLGLAIVKAVADIHHGKIDIRNLEGEKVEFSITLPI